MKWKLVGTVFLVTFCSNSLQLRQGCQSYEYLSNQTKIRAMVPRVIYAQASSWNEDILPLFLHFRVSTGIYVMFHFIAIISFYAYMLSMPPFCRIYPYMSLFEKRQKERSKPVSVQSTDSKASLITSFEENKFPELTAKSRFGEGMSEAKTQRSPRVQRATKGYQEDELATQEKFLDGLESGTEN
ncbi:unnamed protein product [Auanema sp. JU1783]|nr:unnamed protein product [Auanema sp. JU1783]